MAKIDTLLIGYSAVQSNSVTTWHIMADKN